MKSKSIAYTSQYFHCRYCGNHAPFIIHNTCDHIMEERDEDTGMSREVGDIYSILGCPHCSRITITSSFWHDGMEEESDMSYHVLYPNEEQMPRGLPDPIKKGYLSAEKVKGIDANAYAVLMRRLLELVCEDRNAEGDDLFKKLAHLASKHEIPNNLVDVAHGIRGIGNIGAHAGLGNVTEKEIPILRALANAILEYVYSAPYLANVARQRLDELKSAKKK